MKKLFLLLLIVAGAAVTSFSQKALKINTPVALDSGDSTKTGTVLVLQEFYLDLKAADSLNIPCQIVAQLYKSKAAFNGGKFPIRGAADFGIQFRLNFTKVYFESTGNFEIKIITVLKNYLETIYPGNVETINL